MESLIENGTPSKRTQGLARCSPAIYCPGFLQGGIAQHLNYGVERRIDLIDAREVEFHKLGRGDFAVTNHLRLTGT